MKKLQRYGHWTSLCSVVHLLWGGRQPKRRRGEELRDLSEPSSLLTFHLSRLSRNLLCRLPIFSDHQGGSPTETAPFHKAMPIFVSPCHHLVFSNSLKAHSCTPTLKVVINTSSSWFRWWWMSTHFSRTTWFCSWWFWLLLMWSDVALLLMWSAPHQRHNWVGVMATAKLQTAARTDQRPPIDRSCYCV